MSIGVHVGKYSAKKTLHENILESFDLYSTDCCQIFTHGPKSKSKNKINESELSKIKKIYVHSSYVINWDDESMYSEFHTVNDIGAEGLVLHIPKKNAKTVADYTLKFVEYIRKNGLKCLLLLEMKAVTAHETDSYESVDKINNLIHELEERKISESEAKICPDTAHIYAGRADIFSYENAKKYLEKLEPKWIGLIHLNGNAYDSSKRAGDKHVIPFSEDDYIWGEYSYKDSGCRAFIEYAKKNNIDIILEVEAAPENAKSILKFLKMIA